MIDKKTMNERLSALPIDFQLIFLEDLEHTINAHLTVMEKASQKESEKVSLCKSHPKTQGHGRLNFQGSENLENCESTEPAKTRTPERKNSHRSESEPERKAVLF